MNFFGNNNGCGCIILIRLWLWLQQQQRLRLRLLSAAYRRVPPRAAAVSAASDSSIAR